MAGEKTKLSSSTNVAEYRTLEAADDKAALGRFIVERFDERYFQPIMNFLQTSMALRLSRFHAWSSKLSNRFTKGCLIQMGRAERRFRTSSDVILN